MSGELDRGQFAAPLSFRIALCNALWSGIASGRTQRGEVGQISRQAKEALAHRRRLRPMTAFQRAPYLQHLVTKGSPFGPIQSTDANERHPWGCESTNGTIIEHFQMVAKWFLTGVQHTSGVLFRGIALATGVDQILVGTALGWSYPAGTDMIDAHIVIPVGEPAFPTQTIDTLEGKLIPEPRFVGTCILVATGAVLAHMRGSGIMEKHCGVRLQLRIIRQRRDGTLHACHKR